MIEQIIRRLQAYYFLSNAFLYPQTSWLEELPEAQRILDALGVPSSQEIMEAALSIDLAALQAQYREAFGLTGSQCYETEFGLPHEFRQSQELADIAGFYRAFGFQAGGSRHERPDHLAAELEFMYLLALKEAYALENGLVEQAGICQQAQCAFLRDHLGRWVGLFNASLRQSSETRLGVSANDSLYLDLAQLAQEFIASELQRLGLQLEEGSLPEMKPTPFNPDFSCAGCAAAEPVQ
jgi:nitrate reductase assembly molybdenum cofactor insertion protein NarJ